jgi:hypothetical protein
MQVRSVADSAKKFVARAGQARNDYAAGVQNAGGRWQEGAAASAQAWVSGTQEAIAENRFEKGVRSAGPAKYQERATKLGPDRFVTGVSASEQEYARKVAPFTSAMASTNLSPRGARGSQQNARRVQELMDLMRRVRRDTLGG